MNNISKYGLLASLCLGYIAAKTQIAMWYCQYGLIAIVVCSLLLICILFNKTNWKYSGWFCLFSSYSALFLLGVVYYNMRYEPTSVQSNSYYYVSTIVDTLPTHSSNIGYKVSVITSYDADLRNEMILPRPFYMNMYCKKDSNTRSFNPNDTLIIHGDFQAYHGNNIPDAFDYDTYCMKQHIFGWIYVSSSQCEHFISNDTFSHRGGGLDYCKNYCMSRLDSLSMGAKKRHFLKSIILGDKRDLDASLVESFRIAGLAHILAISGLHIGLIYTVLLFLLRVRFHRNWTDWLKQIMVVLVVWGYVCIIGFPMSALRVAIMLTLVHIYRLFVESEWSSIHLLWLTAMGILIYQPEALFDLSFQFSFSAVLGLLLFIPKTNRWFAMSHKDLKKKHLFLYDIRRKSFDFFCVCIVAQVFVAPLAIYYFHYFSLYFWLSALLLPLFTFILYGGLLILLPIPYLTWIVVKIEDLLLSTLFYCSHFIADLPYSKIEIWFNKIDLFLYFLLIIFLYYLLFSKSRRYRRKAVVGCSILLVVLFSYHEYSDYSLEHSCETLLYQKNHVVALNYLDATHNVVIANDSSIVEFSPFKMHWQHRHACIPIYAVTDSVAQEYVKLLNKE
ncbi:ComEC family competence protein [Gammaproteobacteria bacterium]|nr:ComEC family competence protein [Gammaproteobacteria bacterium]